MDLSVAEGTYSGKILNDRLAVEEEDFENFSWTEAGKEMIANTNCLGGSIFKTGQRILNTLARGRSLKREWINLKSSLQHEICSQTESAFSGAHTERLEEAPGKDIAQKNRQLPRLQSLLQHPGQHYVIESLSMILSFLRNASDELWYALHSFF